MDIVYLQCSSQLIAVPRHWSRLGKGRPCPVFSLFYYRLVSTSITDGITNKQKWRRESKKIARGLFWIICPAHLIIFTPLRKSIPATTTTTAYNNEISVCQPQRTGLCIWFINHRQAQSLLLLLFPASYIYKMTWRATPEEASGVLIGPARWYLLYKTPYLYTLSVCLSVCLVLCVFPAKKY